MRLILSIILALFLTAGYSQSDCLIVIPTRGTDSVVLNTNQILYAVQAPSSSTANIVIADFSNVQTRISLDSLIALLPDLIKFTDSQNNYPTGINKQQIREIKRSSTNKAVIFVDWNKQLRYTSTQSYSSVRSLADACNDGTIPSGDKGDITVVSNTWNINDSVVGLDQLQVSGSPSPGDVPVVNVGADGLEWGSASGVSLSVVNSIVARKITTIATKADFKTLADSLFTSGDIVRTRGYATVGDQGASEYLIKTDTIAGYPVDDIAVIQLTVGKYAVLQGQAGYNAAAFGMSTASADNSTALQKAINFTVLTATGGVSVLNLPAGYYTITKGVYVWDGSFSSMTIQGPSPAYSNSQDIGKVTSIRLNCDQCFGIAVERARNIDIKNICFIGNGVTPPGETFVNVLESTWGGLSNNRYSPNAAIVIDPFASTVSAPNQYPGFTSEYASVTGNGGSSHVKIQGCSFYTLGTAICISPNGSTSNGDNIIADQVTASGCRIFWSVGQPQAKGNSITNVYIVGRLLAFVNANAHGEQNGKLPAVDKFNIASGVKYLSVGGIFRGTYTNGFCEGVVCLGTSNLDIIGCQFNFNQSSDRLPFIWSGTLLRVQNSILNYYNNCTGAGVYPMCFGGRVEINNSSIEGAILTGRADASGLVAEHIQLDNVNFQCPLASTYEKSQLIETSLGGRGIIVDGASKIYYKNTAQDNKGTFYVLGVSRAGVLTVDTALRTGRVVMSNPSQIARVGSPLFTQLNVDYSNDILPTGRAPIGVVSSIVNDTVFLTKITLGAVNVTGNLFFGWYNYWSLRVLGNTVSGQNRITVVNAVESGSVDWNSKSPFLISGRGIPVGTYAVNWVVDTIFLSQNATETSNNNVFGGNLGTRQIDLTNPSLATNLIWAVGDEIINSSFSKNGSSPFKWICTTSGVTGTATPPTWRAVYAPVSGNSTAATDVSGDVVITHGFGGTPSVVNITPIGNIRTTLQSISTTAFTVRCYDGITGAAIVSTPVTFYWNAQ